MKLSKRDLLILSIIPVGLVVSTIISSSVGGAKQDDLRTCSDAKYAQEVYVQQYVNTEKSQMFWVQKSFAKELRDLTDRDISPELSEALMDDASRIENSDDFMPIKKLINEFCIAEFGTSY